jgi:hypothetical protein
MNVIGFLYVSLDSSTVQLLDSLGSIGACACSEGCLSRKMAIVLEVYTAEEQRSVVRFCQQKDSMQRIYVNKSFLFKMRSVCRVERFTTGLRNSLKDIRKSRLMSDQVALLRLRQKQLWSGWES